MQDKEGEASYQAPRVEFKLNDFNILGRLGDGSFSTVIRAQYKESGRVYALKIINKHLILRNKVVDYIKNERNILDKLNFPGIAKLYFTFQDEDSLYMGLEHCPGGELYDQIKKRGKLPHSDVVFYAAEIVLILEYLREKQVIHRDLKPENLLLSESGHLRLIDFGSAKASWLSTTQAPNTHGPATVRRATSFVGTAEYVSPEVLHSTPVSHPADLWALGCIIFQMCTGKPPFKGGSEYLTFQLIVEHEVTFPPDFDPATRDLVEKLLRQNPDERIGASDMSELKQHPFFADIKWEGLFSGPAPAFEPPESPTPEEEALDWELTSIARNSLESN